MKKERIVIKADPGDPEDFDVTAEALDRAKRSRLIRVTREALGLSQPDFASRFRVPIGTLRDWEQARVTPPDFAVAYFRVIAAHPDMVAKWRRRGPNRARRCDLAPDGCSSLLWRVDDL